MEKYEYEMDDLTKSQRRTLEKETQNFNVGETKVLADDPDSNAEKSKAQSELDDINAAIDHKPACSITLKDIEVRYGFGMFVYFDFLRVIFVLNIIILIPLAVDMVYHIKSYVSSHDSFKSLSFFLDMLFLTSYEPEERSRWFMSTLMAFGISFLIFWIFPIRLRCMVNRRLKDTLGKDGVDQLNSGRFSQKVVDAITSNNGQDVWENDTMNILPEEMGFIERNLRTSSMSRFLRRFLSLVLFILALVIAVAIQGVVVFRKVARVDLLNYIPDASIGLKFTTISVWDFLVMLVNNTLDFLGKRVAGWCTHLEAHKRRMSHSKHKTIKLFLFKFAVVNTMYITQKIVYMNNYYYMDECPMRSVASKFLVFMLMNLTVGNFMNWIVPIFRYRGIRKAKKKSKPYKPIQFDIAFEYMELFYRQYIMYLGMTVFPMIVPFCILVNIVEYFSDKYRLLSLSRETKKVVLTAFSQWAYFVPSFMSFLSLLAFAAWPDGGMWSLNIFKFTTFVNVGDSASVSSSLAEYRDNYYARCSVFNYTSTPVF